MQCKSETSGRSGEKHQRNDGISKGTEQGGEKVVEKDSDDPCNNAYAFNFDEEVYRHFTDYVFHQPKDRLKWGYGRLPEHENLYGTVKQLLQKEKQLETLTGSGMKEMDYREEIASLEHACSKLVVSLMNIVQQMEKSVTEIFEL